MTDTGGHEKEYGSTDPVGAVNQTNSAEPVATEPLQYVASESEVSSSGLDSEKRGESGKHEDFEPHEKIESEQDVVRTTTTATMTSTLTIESAKDRVNEKKPWYKRLNPLKRSKKPPIPKERIVSREYGASFLSLLTFQCKPPSVHFMTLIMFLWWASGSRDAHLYFKPSRFSHGSVFT